MTYATTTGSFRRSLGIGAFGQVAIFLVLAAVLRVASRFGDEGTAMAVALSFLPALVLVALLYLVMLIVVAAVPSWRARAGSAGGLLLGWLLGTLLVTGLIALVLALV
ncbi:hypothetical protein [Actinoplanes derwentensis]|uniref:Uncharacterized protein n=1 Tax=Actinoplanes derwentensis TaxID=113562 RepID=A0A1H1VJ58_9ACTN|nr:hypothetical protein [Actinoplanes derwentensis]GID83690.1 hypothetical protein Ade03nite_26140 [Actinoplanes derwentensis]SDS84381.1 hypothetical protein SAMN04489716_1767 [Actinoplanes derwentensis]